MAQSPFFQIKVTEQGTVEYRPGTEPGWARAIDGLPHPDLRSQNVWDALQHGGDGKELQFAQALGHWLYDDQAAQLLREHADAGKEPMRIELCLPAPLSGYPWELAAPPGMLSLGVHPQFTLARTCPEPLSDVVAPTRQLDVLLVGVQCNEGSGYGMVLTAHELEAVRSVIANDRSRAFSVQIDPCGSWAQLRERYKRAEPPQVFHFAGHGLPGEKGLVFRGADGNAQPIPVDRLVSLLAPQPGQRKTQLVFLNACYSVGTDSAAHPLGGMVQALHRQGIWAILGVQSRVADRDAQTLAVGFYEQLAKGQSIDVAVQGARRDLHQRLSSAWAFVVLSVRGTPGPLLVKTTDSGNPADPSHFGFDAQHNRIRKLVLRRQPAVVVVHGERRRGHRQCLCRVRRELERSDAVLWRPVAEFQYYGTREPLLQRCQLAGAMAKALGLSDDGSQDQLEQNIADRLVERTRDCVLLIEIVHPIVPASRDEARAVFTLVGELWTSLIGRARKPANDLPAFLLVPIAYEGKRGWKGWGGYPRSTKQTRKVIKQLNAPREHNGSVTVVLPELAPFRAEELEEFFVEACDKPQEEARRLARETLRTGDNEAILERLDHLMARWTP